MAAGPTIVSDVFNPEIVTEAVQAAFAQKTAFFGSRLTSLGVVLVDGTMPEGRQEAIGTSVKVPYFGTIGEFVDNPDGSSITPQKIQQGFEQSVITRDSLGFSVSRWARGNAAVNPNVGDPYEEAARQTMVAAERAMDKRVITAASAPGVYVKDVSALSGSDSLLSWDLAVDAKFDGWGDEQDDIAAMLVHSQAHKDLMKLKDQTGRPLLLSSQQDGGPLDRFCGVPVIVSDRVPVTGSAMGSVTSSGTSPPVLTITGTPKGAYRLVIDCTLGGAHTTAKYKFSLDGGNIWSAEITTLGAGVSQPLVDTAIASQLGVNGDSGLTVAFAAGTFNADNLWTSNTALKVTSLLLKRASLAFWYNKQALAMETDKNIRNHTEEAAMHLYGVAHRYSRLGPQSTKPGVIQIVHRVGGYQ
jgi:hypothetical protein